MEPESAIALIFGVVVLGGVFVIISGMRHRARILEMAHRERLAMIERGMTPSGEIAATYQERPQNRGSRMLSLGIVIVGLGLALAMLIGFASREGEIAIGVGGAVAVIGLAFVVTALVVHAPPKRDDDYLARPGIDQPAPPPSATREPPAPS